MDLQPPRPFAGSLSAYLKTPNLVGRSLKQKFKLACPLILWWESEPNREIPRASGSLLGPREVIKGQSST